MYVCRKSRALHLPAFAVGGPVARCPHQQASTHWKPLLSHSQKPVQRRDASAKITCIVAGTRRTARSIPNPVVSMHHGHWSWKTSRNTLNSGTTLGPCVALKVRCRTNPLLTSWRPCGTVRRPTIQCFSGPHEHWLSESNGSGIPSRAPWMHGCSQVSARTSPVPLGGAGWKPLKPGRVEVVRLKPAPRRVTEGSSRTRL